MNQCDSIALTVRRAGIDYCPNRAIIDTQLTKKANNMSDVYGIVDSLGSHVDVSLSEMGAKNYATRHGYSQVSVRLNSGYHAPIIAEKINGKWVKYDQGMADS